MGKSLTLTSLGPLNNLEREHDEHKRTRQDPNDITLKEQLAHDAGKDVVQLADLRQLQSRRSSSEQETYDDKDWIVENADWYELGEQIGRAHV